MPWKDKFCDFEGFGRGNFASHNVIGTPCFVLVDRDNKLLAKAYSITVIIKEIQEW